MPAAGKARSTVIQWLMFQMGGVGPRQGQANVFFRYSSDKIPAVIQRDQNETKRLHTGLDTRLKDNEYLAGDYRLADIAPWAWVRIHGWAGVEVDILALAPSREWGTLLALHQVLWTLIAFLNSRNKIAPPISRNGPIDPTCLDAGSV